MTHDILSVKLYELDKAIGQMHSRIEQGEMDCPEQVEKDIQELRRECRENREMLHNKMKYSKAKLVGRIAEAYDKVDQVIQIAQEQLGISFTEETTKELSAENKILLAEYFLDFAMQASNYALLMSLEAIHAQNDQPTQNKIFAPRYHKYQGKIGDDNNGQDWKMDSKTPYPDRTDRNFASHSICYWNHKNKNQL